MKYLHLRSDNNVSLSRMSGKKNRTHKKNNFKVSPSRQICNSSKGRNMPFRLPAWLPLALVGSCHHLVSWFAACFLHCS